jgi:hypothetical protein
MARSTRRPAHGPDRAAGGQHHGEHQQRQFQIEADFHGRSMDQDRMPSLSMRRYSACRDNPKDAAARETLPPAARRLASMALRFSPSSSSVPCPFGAGRFRSATFTSPPLASNRAALEQRPGHRYANLIVRLIAADGEILPSAVATTGQHDGGQCLAPLHIDVPVGRFKRDAVTQRSDTGGR